MIDFLQSIFDPSGFPARWYCGEWSSAHGWTHVVSDLLIFGAYMAIPMSIGVFVLKVRDVRLPALWWLFAAFILSCGITHLIDATIFWQPWYRLSGTMKVITAIASWATVFVIWRNLPALSRLPGLAELNEKLRISEEKLRVTIDSIGDAVIATDDSGRITRMNPVAEELTGWTQSEAEGRPVADVLTIVDSKAEPLGSRVTEKFFATDQRVGLSDGCYMVSRDGLKRDISASVAPIREGSDGAVRGAVLIFRDVTQERSVAEEERREIRRSLGFQSTLLDLRDRAGDEEADFLAFFTERLADGVGADRVGVWYLENGGKEIACKDLFLRSEGIHSEGQRLSRGDYPSYFEAIAQREILKVSDARENMATSEFTDSYLEPYGIVSMVDVPIRIDRNLFGVICCEYTGEVREWNQAESDFLSSAGAVVEIALESARRRRAEAQVRAMNENLELLVERRTEELRDSEQRMRLAVQAGKLGIWDWDVTSDSLKWNPQMFAIYGLDSRTENPSYRLWLKSVHPDDREWAESALRAALESDDNPFDCEFRMIRWSDQSVRMVHAIATVLRDENGGILRVLGINRDVTEERQREKKLAEALEKQRDLTRQAEAGERAKGEFLAVMSHEIRTPLNGVLGFAQLLEHSDDLSSEDRDNVETIRQSGEALLRIVDDVLDFVRIGSGKFEAESEPFSPGSLVKAMKEFFERPIREKGLDFHYSISSGVPEMVSGDEGRTRQILTNLFSNAIKFTDHGQIVLEVDYRQEILEFRMIDSGSGLSEADLKRIFNAFEQGDSSLSRKHGGTGLGLAISRRLAVLMGGRLEASSRVSEGTIFTLTLPFPESEPPLEEQERKAPEKDLGKRCPLNILVADDDPMNLKLTLLVLKQMGYSAVTVPDGEKAVAEFEKNAFDVILMDVQMPKLDGIEATRRIREIEESTGRSRIYISAITANIRPEDRGRCIESGMDEVLHKPLVPAQVGDVLKEAYEQMYQEN